MANFRQQKVASEIKRLVGNIINNEIQDPNVPAMCSVISIKVGNDLKHAKVNVSFFEKDLNPDAAIKALNRASGFIRHRLGELMTTRTVPQVSFVYNNAIEHSIKINELLEKVKNENTK